MFFNLVDSLTEAEPRKLEEDGKDFSDGKLESKKYVDNADGSSNSFDESEQLAASVPLIE